MTDPKEIAKALREQRDALAPIQQDLSPSSAAVQIACARHQTGRAAYTEEAAKTAIELEKLLCKSLGKEWHVDGRQSVYTLVHEACERLTRPSNGDRDAVLEEAAMATLRDADDYSDRADRLALAGADEITVQLHEQASAAIRATAEKIRALKKDTPNAP